MTKALDCGTQNSVAARAEGTFHSVRVFIDQVAGVAANVVAHRILLLSHPLHLRTLLKEYHVLLLVGTYLSEWFTTQSVQRERVWVLMVALILRVARALSAGSTPHGLHAHRVLAEGTMHAGTHDRLHTWMASYH